MERVFSGLSAFDWRNAYMMDKLRDERTEKLGRRFSAAAWPLAVEPPGRKLWKLESGEHGAAVQFKWARLRPVAGSTGPTCNWR